jgi:phage terminase large subunit-like protein
VAALYEKGKVSHAGAFRDLEDELTGYVPSMSRKSPDRMDALVWAVSDLVRPPPRLVTV